MTSWIVVPPFLHGRVDKVESEAVRDTYTEFPAANQASTSATDGV